MFELATHHTRYASTREELCSEGGGDAEDNIAAGAQAADSGGETVLCC